MTTLEIVQPILDETYGAGDYINSLGAHLASKIDAFDAHDLQPREEQMARLILLIVWDWCAGGTTAATVTGRIMQALDKEHTT